MPTHNSSPVSDALTMGEGNTPLIRSRRIGPELGLNELWFKYEGANPTGSYKDRFAVAAVTHLAREGKRLCLGTSSGNTGAALAAYCARAGLPCHLAIVEGAPEGKLRQMRAYGAHLLRIRGFGASPDVTLEVMTGLGALARQLDGGVEVSAYAISPRGMAGVESLGRELAATFDGRAFDVFCPAGGGGLTLAVARGLSQSRAEARVHCVQPEGNDTIAGALRRGDSQATPMASTTAISGLQVGAILDGHDVVKACRASGGSGQTISDEEVWAVQSRLARDEGVFCEPAGAVALAGLTTAVRNRELDTSRPVVCLVTGSGFKDERSLVAMTGSAGTPMVESWSEYAGRVSRSI
ncbi:pyridoxal-phosphate dependent enzyme [Synoicihabitans lomoniglobus]|uniref:Pyridoxal-phosphate dependent enzyme n=1 Tax=Synoicihabitans lomoniglobus TaxID=2909285 RepID=A0AAE9ZZS3_9BACT|nr:pyridoxal-phosphate dependent enzyme [Opitutaceae bacterium LMO-M01]WED63682.1 pyridoxal-phosphate dependent enzyme [Opitutaceae bacterium LMO-M01]